MFEYSLVEEFRNHRAVFSGEVCMVVELLHNVGKRGGSVAVVVGDDNTSGESVVVGMCGCKGGTLFGGEFIYFSGGNIIVELVDDFYCESGVVNFEINFIAKDAETA